MLNTRLRTLRCARNDASGAFARERLLPAVRANSVMRAREAGSVAATAELLVVQCAAHNNAE
jgi:hypothetical protein